jgi:hypothetical protein
MIIKPGCLIKRNDDDLSVVLSIVEYPTPRVTLEGTKHETCRVLALVSGQTIKTISVFSDLDEIF